MLHEGCLGKLRRYKAISRQASRLPACKRKAEIDKVLAKPEAREVTMTELVWVAMVVVAVLMHSWVAERSANARETLAQLRHKKITRHLRLQTLWLASIQQGTSPTDEQLSTAWRGE